MAIIHIPEHLARRLEELAEREQRSVDEVAVSILQDHVPSEVTSEEVNPLDAIMGMFDDDVSDLSSTVKETLAEYYKNKYGRPD
jgi:hypothetical protein